MHTPPVANEMNPDLHFDRSRRKPLNTSAIYSVPRCTCQRRQVRGRQKHKITVVQYACSQAAMSTAYAVGAFHALDFMLIGSRDAARREAAGLTIIHSARLE